MNKLILVVDDSPIMRKVVGLGLNRAGFAVETFPNGLELLRRMSLPNVCTPDGVVLDIQMPYLDGYQLAYTLKHRPGYAHTVIIMLSRHDGIFQRLRSRLAGATAHMAKPFQVQELVRLVELHLGVQDRSIDPPFRDFGDPASLVSPHLLSGVPLIDDRAQLL